MYSSVYFTSTQHTRAGAPRRGAPALDMVVMMCGMHACVAFHTRWHKRRVVTLHTARNKGG